MVAGDEGHKQHMPEGKNFLNIGYSEFVNFLDSDNNLGALARLDRGITTLYEKFTWDVQAVQ